SDCCTGYVALPLACWMIQNGYQVNETTCIIEDIYSLTAIWMVSVSSCSIVFIAYDRFLLITKFANYHNILTNRKVTLIISSYWIIIFFLAFGTNYNVYLYVWYNFAAITLPIIFLFCSYFYIWKAVKQSRRRVETNTVSDRRQTQRQIKLAHKVFIIIIGYLIALLPSLTFVILIQINNSNPGFLSLDFITNTFLVVAYIGLSNSCVNPLVYVWGDPEFRRACRQLLRRRSAKVENRPTDIDSTGVANP
uniref:G-protein coupled receptors family 1 profile domain-containing protein n=2 Tax=Clytia hemisphaerica TaxID=252671 RepID=A0A7M5XI68_9CNID